MLALLLVGLTGCDALEVFGGDKEITGLVEEVGDNFLTVDASRYTVNAETTYSGYTSLADVAVGDDVEVSYKDQGGERVAVEIEDNSAPENG